MSQQIPPDEIKKANLKKRLNLIKFKCQLFCAHSESTHRRSLELSNEIYHCLIDLHKEINEMMIFLLIKNRIRFNCK